MDKLNSFVKEFKENNTLVNENMSLKSQLEEVKFNYVRMVSTYTNETVKQNNIIRDYENFNIGDSLNK